ncbi:MAG: 3',5'-cyclic-nucleotide phosphodiesterase [Alectoria fallacina]|uniref:Phosphodiesterase n=1 Tax=Alectoria fallacina TaxID=1903189 RepID=A0A8H3EL83_9LECA|nr:MAG: 3',5'-cyclic-nucleotide phosphodiesterase [Alectoria fallacina]
MDYADYHVVYVDNRVSRDLDGKLVQESKPSRSDGANNHSEDLWEDRNPECLKAVLGEIEEVRSNLNSLLSVFNRVHTCISGDTCMAKVSHLESLSTNIQPVLVMLGTPADDGVEGRSGEISKEPSSSDLADCYGLALLRHISAEISTSSLSKLVVPVAMIYNQGSEHPASYTFMSNRPSRPSSGGFPVFGSKSSSPRRVAGKPTLSEHQQMLRCVDIGATEVLTSPLQRERLRGLTVHTYRAHKEALNERAKFLAQKRVRKRSWLGNNDNKPHAYLREAMVSGLMKGICNPDEELHPIDLKKLPVLESRREEALSRALGSWVFSGHDYSEDELIHAAFLMLQHALNIPELDKWRLSAVDLRTFLMASRAAYNGFVNYHNFRHVVDVMQAIFYFLIQLGTLPPYPISSIQAGVNRPISPVAALLKPFDALTLLITAIGHDVGHPGVNNAFLVALNAPLAQLYNDKSVLEAFHCAAYSQILRRYWKAAFEDIPMRGLMINSILATDMGMHFNYMKELGNLQVKVHHNNGTNCWSPQVLDDYRILTCALLIKCADISNVARPFEVAAKWANILQLEFANQGVMEKDVGIPTTLFGGPPELGNLVKLGNSQNSFMNIFARPLFEAVTDILPAMAFAVDEMKVNQEIWTEKIKSQTFKGDAMGWKKQRSSEGLLSPRSGSPDRPASQPEFSHPEGLPASQPLETSPNAQAAQFADEPRRASASSIPHHLGSFDSGAQSQNTSRRSSLGRNLNQINTTPDSASYSRRSSGASPAASTSHATVTTRRLNNSSPSQLQLGLIADLRSQTASSVAISENIQPQGRASEDTLSQTAFSGTGLSTNGSRRGSCGSAGAGDISRRGSKGDDTENWRSNRFTTNTIVGRPYAHSAHHRSSSGAHTNNTNLSQSTPYSPTGTQATSVLTVDSDEKSSQSRLDSWTSPELKGMPDVVNLERPRIRHRPGIVTGPDGAKDTDIKTSVMSNGSMRDWGGHQRVVGRKGSRFNFNFWKKRGKSVEASP